MLRAFARRVVGDGIDPSVEVDSLNIFGLEESPAKLEAVITEQQSLAERDGSIQALLASIYLSADRADDFARYLGSRDFEVTVKLLELFGVHRSDRICEIGGGPGFLAWALVQSGFLHVELLEPSDYFHTGTGYLKTRPDAARMVIHRDLADWHAASTTFDVVVTKNCIHHFKNLSQSAATIRQKMRKNGLWFSFREWFADSPRELYTLIATHPFCQPYGLYEWPYPAHHYAEAIEIAGFELVAVVPSGYANNCLSCFAEEPFSATERAAMAEMERVLKASPSRTVSSFWAEVDAGRRKGRFARLYTRAQMMLFRRIEI
jgi:2-polyprenyl-3-methyl-5-hydroxy-6-metoxy-1,4-benzoquinol methylase